MTCKIYFLLCITFETRLVSLYSNRVIYTGISIRTIFVLKSISLMVAEAMRMIPVCVKGMINIITTTITPDKS